MIGKEGEFGFREVRGKEERLGGLDGENGNTSGGRECESEELIEGGEAVEGRLLDEQDESVDLISNGTCFHNCVHPLPCFIGGFVYIHWVKKCTIS